MKLTDAKMDTETQKSKSQGLVGKRIQKSFITSGQGQTVCQPTSRGKQRWLNYMKGNTRQVFSFVVKLHRSERV